MPLFLYSLLLFAHVAAVVVWVGGMFFSHLCLRPVAMRLLDGPLRLQFWRAVFQRFFPLVWAAVIIIAASGGLLLGRVGMTQAPPGWHLMMALGLVMMGIFVHVQFGPFASFCRALEQENWESAALQLARIRRRVTLNLVLGVVTIACATLGLAF